MTISRLLLAKHSQSRPRGKMIRPSYRAGVRWIAENHDGVPGDVAMTAAIELLAELFGVDEERIHDDLFRYWKEQTEGREYIP